MQINNMAIIIFDPAKPATERGCREKDRQKEEEEGECTLREVRPRFRDPRPHTPQVLWHCLYECARRTQTHRISVWLSMSPGAEPIGRDKAGLIASSSASQREAFFYLNHCLRAALHITSISDSGPTWHLPFVFLSISVSTSSILSLWPTPSVHHGPYHQQEPLPLPLRWKLASQSAPALTVFCFFPVVMCSARCASSSLTTKSH